MPLDRKMEGYFFGDYAGKDESLADLDNLPDPEKIAGDIIEKLEAGLQRFREIMIKLKI